jgi:beta-phosphoglucomutase-like phosphatase (HAD superfamily)
MGRISFGFIESGYSDSHFGCGAQEDAPYDIEAARKAGLKAIALRCGGFPEETLRGAIATYDDPADLLSRYSDSHLTAS